MDDTKCFILSSFVMQIIKIHRNTCNHFSAETLCLTNNNKYFVKINTNKHINREAITLNYFFDKISVPKVYRFGCFNTYYFIITEFIENCINLNNYLGLVSNELYNNIQQTIAFIRNTEMIGIFDNSCLHDPYLVEEIHYIDINDFMMRRLKILDINKSNINLPDISLCFSHCLLLPENILISDDGKELKAILNWRYCGFYPDFYEYYKYNHMYKHEILSFDIEEWLSMFATDSIERVKNIEKIISDFNSY